MIEFPKEHVKYIAIKRTVPSIEPSPIFDVYIGLGSNLGNKSENLNKALDMLAETPHVKVLSVSKFYETVPVGIKDQPDFLNAAAKVDTTLEPLDFLDVCQSIEKSLKRIRTVRWGPRTIDIDILLYGNLIFRTERLIIPHPEMCKREFVLRPLNEIAPEVIEPVNGMTIAMLYEQIRLVSDR